MRPQRPQEEQILVWCGVVAQLTRTRANRILRDAELPYPLFVLLRHFCHDPAREWTVSQLTAAFETEQPGMTKKVQKLRALGLLASRRDDADRRQRWLKVTPAGVRLRNKLVKRLEPDRDHIFRGWSRAQISQLHRSLDRLRTELDAERDGVVVPSRARRP
ncbi:MAG: MarR family winged helix-turn-helix transcriptional regulator [Myxococcota bacterium]